MTSQPLSGPAPPTERSHREILIIFGAVMMGMLLPAFNVMAISTALPTIVGELGGLAQISWIVTAYLLAATVSVPLWGKISDLYGRRLLFQLAIWVFIAGSILSGLAQTMDQLIIARGAQGLGGGGLMALSQAIIGDVVAPRQRGRYQGYIGMVFAVASIAGPLAGGFFVDHLSWRWIFFVSIPMGLVALFVTNRYLRITHERREHRIDYLGAALLTYAATGLLLVSVWGGVQYPWGSPMILGLAATSVVAAVSFVFVERGAPEPIIPLELFRNRVFTVATLLGFIVGTTMFGTFVFVPLFLQGVAGMSAAGSGLMLLPVMLGLVTTTVVSGRLITRWGRYKVFPVTGTALMVAGFGLLSTLGPETGLVQTAFFLALLGVSIGMTMQVLVLAVQNSVEFQHLGTATSAAHFLRMMGGTVGVAAYGAILNLRVGRQIGRELPGDLDARALIDDPTRISELPTRLQGVLQQALSDGVTFLFAIAAIVGILAFAMALLLREIPLRDEPFSAPPPRG